jgi:hypothetical protein
LATLSNFPCPQPSLNVLRFVKTKKLNQLP